MVGSKGMANFKVVYACVYECERRDKVTPQTLKHWARVTREERSNPERGGVGWLGLACAACPPHFQNLWYGKESS